MALADLLLAIAVLAMVLAAAMPLLARQGDELAAKAIADDLRLFRIGAEEHFKSNRAAYEAAMVDGTGAGQLCRLGVNPVDGSGGTQANSTTLHTCAVDGTQLAYLRALPSGLRPRNVYGESWVAIHRLVDGGGSPSAGVETLFVSAAVASGGGALPLDPQRWQIARSAAAQMPRGRDLSGLRRRLDREPGAVRQRNRIGAVRQPASELSSTIRSPVSTGV
jgi:type II secretory pathway pseudopilin PulG